MTIAAVGSTAAAAGAAGAGAFALAAIPARYVLEREAWSEAAALTVRPTPAAPYTEAITHFARGLGAARGGKPADAAVEIERLTAIKARMLEMKDAYWAEQVDIQRRVVEAWKVYAEGDKAKGVELLRAGRRCRGPDRQVSRYAGPDCAGAGDARLHAARGRPAQGGTGGVPDDDQQGTRPVPRAATAPLAPLKPPATRLRRRRSTRSCWTAAGAVTTNRQSLARARQQSASR